MSFSRSPAVAVGLLVAAGACSISTAWADTAQTVKAHPWVLLAIFWGAALLSVSLHYLLQYLARAAARVRRSWHQQAALRLRLRRRARIHAVHAAGAVRRVVAAAARQLPAAPALPERAMAFAGRAWDWAKDAAHRISEQPMAGARRAPGAVGGVLIGWSRSALKVLRA